MLTVQQVSYGMDGYDSIEPSHLQVTKHAVSDGAVRWAAETYALACAVEGAVLNHHVLAHRLFLAGRTYRTHDDAVVAGLQVAVAYAHMPAAVHVESVVVDHFLVSDDLDAVCREVLALPDPASPAGAVLESYVLETHVAAIEKLNHSRARMRRLRIEPLP